MPPNLLFPLAEIERLHVRREICIDLAASRVVVHTLVRSLPNHRESRALFWVMLRRLGFLNAPFRTATALRKTPYVRLSLSKEARPML